jgi:hypothetical protein
MAQDKRSGGGPLVEDVSGAECRCVLRHEPISRQHGRLAAQFTDPMAKVLHVHGEYSLNKAAMPFDFFGEQTFHKK